MRMSGIGRASGSPMRGESSPSVKATAFARASESLTSVARTQHVSTTWQV